MNLKLDMVTDLKIGKEHIKDLINLIPTKHYFVCHEVLGVHIAF